MNRAALGIRLLLIRIGQGTPLPLDPPKRFVVAGPYRYVRNPMLLGMGLALLGETVWWQSWVTLWYAAGVAAAAAAWVRLAEEPELGRRFGSSYAEYRARVPRWLPRLPERRKRH